MSHRSLTATGICFLSLSMALSAPAASYVPTTISFQGVLTDSAGSPVADGDYSVTFTIYDADVAGNSKWAEIQTVSARDGLFSVMLGSINPILDSVFNDTPRYLGIQVEGDPEATPRVELGSAPYAQRVATVDGATGGVLKTPLLFSDSLTLGDKPMAYLFETAPSSPKTRSILARAPFWEEYGLSYNFASPGLEYFSFKNGPTVMSIHMGSQFVGIGTDAPDYTLDVNGTVHANGVAMGVNPSRSGFQATIGGGGQNTTSAGWATVAGGVLNVGGGEAATVSGGYSNSANGDYAMTPGGRFCDATGHYSLAAGRRAKALHEGAFVWADSIDQDFATTAAGQFQVRATGGANIFTNESLTAGVTLAAGGSSWSAVCDSSVKANIRPVDGQEILDKLSQLEISRWNYEAQDPSVEHIGPMAQDFHRLFGLGEDDRHINTLDPDGVSLAAIKALIERNARLESEVAALRALVERLIESQ